MNENGVLGTQNQSVANEAVDQGERPPDFLELIYGVLFEPAVTFRKISPRPPLGQAFLIFTLVNLIVALLNSLVALQFIPEQITGTAFTFVKAFVPGIVILGLVFQYGKWFVWSSLLHLGAEFLGGKGRAVGVWAVSGLASLPAIFLAPVDLLFLLFGNKTPLFFLLTLFVLFVFVWSGLILVIGLRQEHSLSTGRAVAVVLIPAGAVLVAITILAVIFAVVTASSLSLSVLGR